MATSNRVLTLGVVVAGAYDAQLAGVMTELSTRIMQIVRQATVSGTELYDATLFLNYFPEMIAALDAAGYNTLSREYVKQYKRVAPEVTKLFAGLGGPKPSLATASKETLAHMARADLTNFAALGRQGVQTLHFGVYKAMVGRQEFSSIVDMVRRATVGVQGKRGSMANHAYTHANTAFQQFSGEVVISAAESVGHGGPDSLWEVTGPSDDATRDVCSDALADPIRTRKEWEAAGYWGGAPGGWNCRHQVEPVFK